MATIALYAGKINNMSNLISDTKKSVNNLKSDLFTLKNKSLSINRNICNLDDVVSSISAATKTQEEKILNLDKINKNVNDFIAETVKIDGEAADIINKNKRDFYNKYDYLKPDSEKSVWEKIIDNCKKAYEWCRENWESIKNIALAVIAVIAIVAASIATFGAAAVALAAIVGAIVGFAGQFISDLISWKITGEWTGTWQSYLGAILGGIAGGALGVAGNPVAACMVDAAISTFFSENLENVTGGEKRSTYEILTDTVINTLLAGSFGVLFNNYSGKLGQILLDNCPNFVNSLKKSGNKIVSTVVRDKLIKSIFSKPSIKQFANKVITQLIDDIPKNISYGLGLDDIIKDKVYDPKLDAFMSTYMNINMDRIGILQLP